MKKKITYKNEKLQFGKRVKDFLPSPEELALSEKTKRVTINLQENSLDAFKQEARRLKVPYQKLIRKVIDHYAKHFLL